VNARLPMRLPALIHRSPSGLLYFVYWAPFIALYQLANRWHLVTPVQLPFTALDRAIPFVPSLLPVYVAYIPLFWWTVWRSEDDRQANRVFYATYLQLFLCLPFFILFPVEMPRQLFYSATAYNWADAFWRWFDAPTNCFPSLHVANCALFIELNWPRRFRWAATLAAAAVIASTVLVKQHYVVDVVAGAVVYLLARWLLEQVTIAADEPVHAAAATEMSPASRGSTQRH